METLCNLALSKDEKENMIRRFPPAIKLSYETIAHKKVPDEYDLCIAVPHGKKAYVWWTYVKNKLVCCLLELNRTMVIGENVSYIHAPMPKGFELGTIVSGYLLDEDSHTFLVDDLFMLKGIILHEYQTTCFDTKAPYLLHFFEQMQEKKDWKFKCCSMWTRQDVPDVSHVPYNIRYIQYQTTKLVSPNLNVALYKKPIWNPIIDAHSLAPQARKISKIVPDGVLHLNHHHYLHTCIFWVTADVAYDVYYLFAKSPDKSPALYQYAAVPDYKTSVFMNGIFRRIRENANLDFIEESEDEEDYENVAYDKFVDLEKMVLMECTFDRRFKKWIPLRIKGDEKQVPYLHQLFLKGPADRFRKPRAATNKLLSPSSSSSPNGLSGNSRFL